jgi:flagellar biosynthesis/type III secretory pathway chaperone
MIADMRGLIDALRDEVELLDKLHSVLCEQRSALAGGDTQQIRRTVEQQIAILKRVGALETKRQALLAGMTDLTGDGKLPSLSILIEHAAEADARHLRQTRDSLCRVVEGIGNVNRQNDMLIRQSLSYIDRMLRMIAGEDDSSRVYTVDGEVTCPTGRIVVDRKI